VYLGSHCSTFAGALEVVRKVRERFPHVRVETFDVDLKPAHEKVFAVPTYMLDDRIAFLLNPTDDEVNDLLKGST